MNARGRRGDAGESSLFGERMRKPIVLLQTEAGQFQFIGIHTGESFTTAIYAPVG